MLVLLVELPQHKTLMRVPEIKFIYILVEILLSAQLSSVGRAYDCRSHRSSYRMVTGSIPVAEISFLVYFWI